MVLEVQGKGRKCEIMSKGGMPLVGMRDPWHVAISNLGRPSQYCCVVPSSRVQLHGGGGDSDLIRTGFVPGGHNQIRKE